MVATCCLTSYTMSDDEDADSVHEDYNWAALMAYDTEIGSLGPHGQRCLR